MRKFLSRMNLKRGIWDAAYFNGYCAGQYDFEKGKYWNTGMTASEYEAHYQYYKPRLKDLLVR